MKTFRISMFLVTSVFFVILFSGCEKTFNKREPELKKAKITNPTVTDIDDNVYHTVIIGTQVWMVENLKTTKYNDGTPVSYRSDINDDDGYSWYNNDINYKNPYGALYGWGVVATRKLAPVGWHVADMADWHLLINYLGENAFNKLQEAGSAHWTIPNPDATNSSGFTALPAGCFMKSQFQGIGTLALWWESSHYISFPEVIGLGSGYFSGGDAFEGWIFSVRCLKDALPTLTTTSVSEITATTAKSGGYITCIGGLQITACGVCWNTSHNPSIKDTKTIDPTADSHLIDILPYLGQGPFTSSIMGLKPNTTYYVRAYATNSLGTAYGQELSFKTLKK
jgi:uncharacterized protein (TIGR02145 family)